MNLLIWVLSFFLILDCLLLGLLILLQLPKKEAGIGGTAFGGDAAVAVFGAGSGNALTKLTKYTAGIFLVLCLLLSWLGARQSKSGSLGVREKIAETATPASPVSSGLSNLLAPVPAATLPAASNAAVRTAAAATNASPAKP
jgi:preprotein translocase subunit SecG